MLNPLLILFIEVKKISLLPFHIFFIIRLNNIDKGGTKWFLQKK